jgi:Fe-S cluster biogenesis protein NfuA
VRVSSSPYRETGARRKAARIRIHLPKDIPHMSALQKMEVITATIEELRPGLQRDGGDIELVDVAGDIIKVRLSGACTTCTLAGQTLGGVRRKLMAALGEPVRVVPAPVD